MRSVRPQGASGLSLSEAYSGSANQWVASLFKAANSPTSAEKSRAASLNTSFWSYGLI